MRIDVEFKDGQIYLVGEMDTIITDTLTDVGALLETMAELDYETNSKHNIE